jgi:hypothetical protein
MELLDAEIGGPSIPIKGSLMLRVMTLPAQKVIRTDYKIFHIKLLSADFNIESLTRP